MGQRPTHRKRVKHFDEAGHVHELTFSCYQRRPLLADASRLALLGTAVDRARRRHGYRLLAFVFMPDHVHLLVQPQEGAAKIEALLRAIKRPSSYRIKEQLQLGSPGLLEELTIRQRPGVMTFRFWQEGPGYDRNLTEPAVIRKAIDYVHCNPVRRGLCQSAVDWKWSSARQLVTDLPVFGADVPTVDPIPLDVLG